MAEDASRERDAREQSQRAGRAPSALSENIAIPEEEPAQLNSLFGDPRLMERGNEPVRVALVQRMQQTYGNRATQRLLNRSEEPKGQARSHETGLPRNVQRFLRDRATIQRAQHAGPVPDARGAEQTPTHTRNNTGLPDQIKAGAETLSGLPLDDVRVHYNSPEPAQLDALAYTQGTEIHVGPGQEEHLPHEAWHVVQQKRGQVPPTLQFQGAAVNDNHELEAEADEMGLRAGAAPDQTRLAQPTSSPVAVQPYSGVIQRRQIHLKSGKKIKTELMTREALLAMAAEIRRTDPDGAGEIDAAIEAGEVLNLKRNERDEDLEPDEDEPDDDEGAAETGPRAAESSGRPTRTRKAVVKMEDQQADKRERRKARQQIGVQKESEVQGDLTAKLERLAVIIHNPEAFKTEAQRYAYIATGVPPKGAKLDTQGTTAVGYLNGVYYIARQSRLAAEPPNFNGILARLRLPEGRVVVISARDLLVQESAGLHGESYIIQYLFRLFLQRKGIEPRLMRPNDEGDRNLIQEFLSDVVLQLHIGASQEACWDCAGFLNSILVAHGSVRATPSDKWVHPLTGEAFDSEHNPKRTDVKASPAKRANTGGRLEFRIANFVPRPNAAVRFGFHFPDQVLEAIRRGDLKAEDRFTINGIEFRVAEHKETGYLTMAAVLRGG